MIIRINGFDSASVAAAIGELRRISKDLKKNVVDECYRLAQIGQSVAQSAFSNAAYDGINDVSVSAEPTESGARVRASGEAAMFIEYGAGVHHNGSGIYPAPLPEGMAGIGGYGKGNGNKDYWFYTGLPGTAGGALANGHTNTTITHGNPPACGMYYAEQAIKSEIENGSEAIL